MVGGKSRWSNREGCLARDGEGFGMELMTEIGSEEDEGSHLESPGEEKHLVTDVTTEEIA